MERPAVTSPVPAPRICSASSRVRRTLLENGEGAAYEGLAQRRRDDSSGASLEERSAEFPLEVRQTACQRRLRDVEMSRCGADASLLRDSDGDGELMQLHGELGYQIAIRRNYLASVPASAAALVIGKIRVALNSEPIGGESA